MGKERNVPWEEILGRRKEGETARALAEEFGVSVESVYKRGQRERLEQRGSLQQAARNLCRSAGSMVAQMEDMDAKELKELTALLRELVTLKAIANGLQHRTRANYRFIMSFNSMLIVLGAMGILPPATSALLHNASTLGVSLKSMTNLLT